MSDHICREIIVNGEAISMANIAAEAQNHPAPSGLPDDALEAAARALVMRTLCLQEARRIGLKVTPRIIGPGKRETDEEALIRVLLEEQIKPEPIDVAHARKIYDSAPSLYRGPTIYDAAHILYPAAPDDPAARSEAEAKATWAIAMLSHCPSAFEEMARHESACSSRENGGRLGQITTGDTVVEFEQALDQMKEGEILDLPVATRFGYHVVRLDRREEGAVLPFETAAPLIIDRMERTAWARAAQEFVALLVAEASVEGIDLRAIHRSMAQKAGQAKASR